MLRRSKGIPSKLTLSAFRPCAFHPALILACSLAGACLYAIYAALRFPADKLPGQYLYVAPIVVPFVAFLFDRAERLRLLTPVQLAVDAAVVLTAMWRVFGDVPYVSGHALFLTFALLSSRRRVAQATAAVILLEVVYLKFFVWHDWITATVGVLAGSAAAFISRRQREGARPERSASGPAI